MLLDNSKDVFISSNVRVRAPDGDFYIILLEDKEGEVFKIECHVGKNGSSVRAWSSALCNILSHQLEAKKITLEDIVRQTVAITSDRSVLNISSGLICRSGPEAIGLAIQSYLTDKFLSQKYDETSELYDDKGRYKGYLIPKFEVNDEDEEDDDDDD